MTETIGIAPMRKEMVESLWDFFRVVCEEDNCLGFLHAPSLEEMRNYTVQMLEVRNPMIVAFLPGVKIIGCCDIKKREVSSFKNCGTLGVSVHPDYRRREIGSAIMERAIKIARTRGYERIELEAFKSNDAALRLYEKFGFEFNGILKRGRHVEGGYSDIVQMARWLDDEKKSWK